MPMPRLPVMVAVPDTCSFCTGEEVPTPTFPEVACIYIRVELLVKSRKGIALVVPSLEEVEALEFPKRVQLCACSTWMFSKAIKAITTEGKNRRLLIKMIYK